MLRFSPLIHPKGLKPPSSITTWGNRSSSSRPQSTMSPSLTLTESAGTNCSVTPAGNGPNARFSRMLSMCPPTESISSKLKSSTDYLKLLKVLLRVTPCRHSVRLYKVPVALPDNATADCYRHLSSQSRRSVELDGRVCRRFAFSFLCGWRSTPGTILDTSQLARLNSMTATSV